ncbi:hypothetical protein HPB49_007622 [Dermacentor silvarum]|uniref:Uncharacterized protein n=1 Tax=Dermacentor silvarum TaxID=543639 RepID=A0ACB8DX81_DERSI|nr:hypothetical protein HPB49_007622 [Dermacentor silvarum]
MMGFTNQALVTFSGIQVPCYVRMYGAELRCYITNPVNRYAVCACPWVIERTSAPHPTNPAV